MLPPADAQPACNQQPAHVQPPTYEQPPTYVQPPLPGQPASGQQQSFGQPLSYEQPPAYEPAPSGQPQYSRPQGQGDSAMRIIGILIIVTAVLNLLLNLLSNVLGSYIGYSSVLYLLAVVILGLPLAGVLVAAGIVGFRAAGKLSRQRIAGTWAIIGGIGDILLALSMILGFISAQVVYIRLDYAGSALYQVFSLLLLLLSLVAAVMWIVSSAMSGKSGKTIVALLIAGAIFIFYRLLGFFVISRIYTFILSFFDYDYDIFKVIIILISTLLSLLMVTALALRGIALMQASRRV
jgi:hypothetical protein